MSAEGILTVEELADVTHQSVEQLRKDRRAASELTERDER